MPGDNPLRAGQAVSGGCEDSRIRPVAGLRALLPPFRRGMLLAATSLSTLLFAVPVRAQDAAERTGTA
ncbi:MAG TPA: hypothetical protein PLL33_09835, partial [Paracoccus sp. (in: a-proteobacteria)]|nr:hypothetical protein [Paracoccus sp. (in: a-proteobacteria)]